MFLAKISKGRTIREYVLGTILAPSLYCFVWLILYGGVALRLERESSGIGLCCKDALGWFRHEGNISHSLSQRGIEDQIIQAHDSSWMCLGKCGECASTIIKNKANANETYMEFLDEYRYFGSDFGSISADRSFSRLSCHSIEQMWFDVMRSYRGIGKFLGFFSLFAIVLYFVTSSDSGSLVIDCLSANGDPDPPRIQRVFWAFMEGATATALLVAGGEDGLNALQTAGIVSGLPYTVVICLLCTATWRAVQVAAGDLDPFGPTFACGLFDALGAQPFKK